ncbi:hypothetical protein [Tautonia sociabilis]|uniref:DUF805 domain-containing protein n=1 Tax=Tautonia sociabilis TaxID=2080755 RepID=A0A432MEB2_9BACT|nr:hypothetical protein [Tautonia sociabilis]RUL83655.1 hypothetical protein TsocGM_21720 [Tautonia sociabilis]
MTGENPDEAPTGDLSASRGTPEAGRRSRGIGRLGVAGGLALAVLVGAIAEGQTARRPDEEAPGLAATLAVALAVGLLTARRAANLGGIGWLALLLLVPVIPYLLLFCCLAFPKGWADHRRLDPPAWVLTGLVLGMLALAVAALVRSTILPR